jgi:hypothetical protein
MKARFCDECKHMNDLIERLRALARCEHSDVSVAEEAAAELRRLHVQAAQDEALLRQALERLEAVVERFDHYMGDNECRPIVEGGWRRNRAGKEGCMTEDLDDLLCPHSAAGRPERFPAKACILAGECGCAYGAEWSRALRLADDAAESVICKAAPGSVAAWNMRAGAREVE